MALRDYSININKQVNRLVPWYLRGRNMLLFLQSVSSPLGFFNDPDTGFNPWAHKKLYELSMTSQKIRLEYHINSVIVPENNITLVSGKRVTIIDDEYAAVIAYFRNEITDQATAPLFYPSSIPTVTRLRTNTADKAKQRVATRLLFEHGGTAGKFIISVPYTGSNKDEVSRIITSGISRYIPVGIVFSIKYTN